MNVGEIVAALSAMPPEAEVRICAEETDEGGSWPIHAVVQIDSETVLVEVGMP